MAATGSLYSLLLERGIDAFWLLKIHAGRFGPLNLQPYDSGLLGLFTLVVGEHGHHSRVGDGCGVRTSTQPRGRPVAWWPHHGRT